MVDNSKPNSSDIAIEVCQLRKEFGVLRAVDCVNFDLKRGEFLSVFGPNGAGKTTLIKILTGLTRPSSGTAKVAGYNVEEGMPAMRREIGRYLSFVGFVCRPDSNGKPYIFWQDVWIGTPKRVSPEGA
jgi:ABC-type branched-subunit amino acid transport system ATPase component